MDFIEKDLEQIIWESDHKKLYERGLFISGKRYRQLRIGNYGISDIITVERLHDAMDESISYLNITVFELKKDKVGVSALFQSIRYCRGIQRYFELKHPDVNMNLNIVLIGRYVDDTGEMIYIPDLFCNNFDYMQEYNRGIRSVSFYRYEYAIDGILFENVSGYKLVNEGF